MAEPHGFDKSDETIDGILQGKLSIIQRRTGYRFSIDALLLAHFVAPRKYDRIVELGAGSGVVALALAMLHPVSHLRRRVAGRIGRQGEKKRRAQRLDPQGHDTRRKCPRDREPFRAQTFDLVVANPPYRSPRAEKSIR
jgi:tRNA1Val (adenine37-N6)-methyltransferase